MKDFVKICRFHKNDLKEYAAEQLKQTHEHVIVDDGYIYAQGNFPVLLVAHMDTVHENLPDQIFYSDVDDILSSPNGIGGDDRCGIYMVFEVLKRYNCSVLFTEDEERGCIGAHKFAKTPLAKNLEFNYIIEFDRKGNNDAVFYDCDNPDFEDFITKEFFKTSWGTCSDISVIAPTLGVAAVNLSCGYYNAHTKEEYVVFYEMKKVIEEACKILERTTEDDKFEYIEAEYDYSWAGYGYGGYGYGGGSFAVKEDYFIIEYSGEDGNVEWYDTMALSEEEAVGRFCMDNPTIPYGSIYCVYNDAEVSSSGSRR